MTISIEHTGFTDLGTGTAKTQLGGASVTLPAWARTLLAITPVQVIDVPTAAETVWTKVSLESNDFGYIQPFEVLGTPIAGFLGSISNGTIARPEKWLVGVGFNGGDRIDVYNTPQVANTGAGLTAGCSLIVSDGPAGYNQRHAKMGTNTLSGTTGTSDIAGTPYTFTAGSVVKELFGSFGHTTVAAASSVPAYLKFVSSEFSPSVTPKLPLNPVGAGLSTTIGLFIDGVSRMFVDIACRSPTTISDYLYMGIVPTVQGRFQSGVIYE